MSPPWANIWQSDFFELEFWQSENIAKAYVKVKLVGLMEMNIPSGKEWCMKKKKRSDTKKILSYVFDERD